MAKAESNKEEKPVVAPVVAVQKKDKVYSFEQWAQLRKKPASHLRGMKAFLREKSNHKYSLSKWDEIFQAY